MINLNLTIMETKYRKNKKERKWSQGHTSG